MKRLCRKIIIITILLSSVLPLAVSARWYDTKTGRFLSPDPIWPAGGLNAYTYVGNNPLKYTDPLGLEPVSGAAGEPAPPSWISPGELSRQRWASQNRVFGPPLDSPALRRIRNVAVGLGIGAVGGFAFRTLGSFFGPTAAEVAGSTAGAFGVLAPRIKSCEESAITASGITRIEEHLRQIDALNVPENIAMLERLRAGRMSAHDLAFYQHELIEAELVASGLSAAEAHMRTLQRQGIEYAPGYEANLYHPDVISRYRESFNPRAWPNK